MDYLAALTTLASKFTVARVPGALTLEPSFRIDPPPEAVGPQGLILNETLQEVAQVDVPMKIDLTFLGKWVRSVNSDLPPEPATEDPIGGMPVVEQLVTNLGVAPTLSNTLPPGSLMTSDPGQAAVPGVPEVLGRVKGTINQTVEKLTDVLRSLQVTVAVRWRVFDESTGTPVTATNVQYRTTPPPAPPAARGFARLPTELLVPANGTPAAGTSLALFLQLPETFTELTSGTPDVMTFTVRCSIKLSVTPTGAANPVTTGFIDLPPVPLVVPTIPVPTILVLCEHRNFGGRKLVLIPSNSLIGAATGAGGIGIGQALALTNSALASLRPINTLIGFLAASAGTSADIAANVLKALASSPGQTIIAAQSRVNDLSASQFVFEPGVLGIGRFTGDNMASSIICIGRMGTVFDLFQDPNLVERITRLQITADGSLGYAISKLDLTDPTPDVVYGASVTSFSPVWAHEDRITSVGFAGPGARFISLPFPP